MLPHFPSAQDSSESGEMLSTFDHIRALVQFQGLVSISKLGFPTTSEQAAKARAT